MPEVVDLRETSERLTPRRRRSDPSVVEAVGSIIERVRSEGDAALLELTLGFDHADLRESGLLVTPTEFERARAATPHVLQRSIDALVDRLTDLHRRQIPPEWSEESGGVRAGEIVRALGRVGCYVPGGRATYPSTVAMTVVPASVVGVEEILVCSPPGSDGSLAPAVLYTAAHAGATRVAKVGGAQAVAALAYGTESVPAVDLIVGPGNTYVTEAKRQVAGDVGIDGLAGPTELAVVADASADAGLLAADLVAQAEHDPEASTTLITTDPGLVDRAAVALEAELANTGRHAIVAAAISKNRTVLVSDEAQAAQAVNDLAPEHLLVLLSDAREFVAGVRNAGAIFLGEWTAVPFGDYGVASNHVLPTAGTARFSSGLRAADFVRISSVVEMNAAAARRLTPEAALIARSEGLIGHARAMEIRIQREPEQ